MSKPREQCPKCRGKGHIAIGKHSLMEWPIAAFDATRERCAGNEVRECIICRGKGVVSPELAQAVRDDDAKAAEAVAAILRA